MSKTQVLTGDAQRTAAEDWSQGAHDQEQSNHEVGGRNGAATPCLAAEAAPEDERA